MSKRTKIKPSDVVAFNRTPDESRWTLVKLNPSVRLVDKTPARYGGTPKPAKRWHAIITCTAQVRSNALIEHDYGARVWRLVTEGEHVGSRRYRYGLTLAEAQNVALAWLDRRFTVQDPE